MTKAIPNGTALKPVKFGLDWTNKRKKRIAKSFKTDSADKIFLSTRFLSDTDFENAIAQLERELAGVRA